MPQRLKAALELGTKPLEVAIVDFGTGNLFSVERACAQVGMHATITHDPGVADAADALILPGVGAFGYAMRNLEASGMDDALRAAAKRGVPIMGVCLGQQLFMDSSEELGANKGLGLVPGRVVRLAATGPTGPLKVPHIGWSRIHRPHADAWHNTPLENVAEGSYMYFVHSYHARPRDAGAVLATVSFGQESVCAAILRDNIVAFQFHPERSGPDGLAVYRAFATWARARA